MAQVAQIEKEPPVRLRDGLEHRVGTEPPAARRISPRHVALLIDRLNFGGSERQLVVLADRLREAGHTVVVMVFYGGGALESELHARGVRVLVLEKRARWDVVRFGIGVLRVVRRERFDVLYGYSGVPNIIGAALKALCPGLKVIWGIRASDMQLENYGWLPPILDRVAATMSRLPDLVIANSAAGLAHALSRGYAPRRAVVIPNGIDTERFAPSPAARARLRADWGLREGDKVVGLVGRLDPMKGHQTFLAAAAMLAPRRRDVRFVCVGSGPADYHARLQQFARERGVENRVRWIPAHPRVDEIYNALDILCSASSYGEGFPNVVGEAMATGVPCVVTDVGDSARVLGRPSLTVPPDQPELLVERLEMLLDAPTGQIARLGAEGRQRILSQFSIDRLVRTTDEAILSLF